MLSEKDLLQRLEGITIDEVRYCVRQGWVMPSPVIGDNAANEEAAPAVFFEVDVARLRLIRELRHDLEIGDDAIPVVLSLLDRVHTLRAEMRLLGHAISEQSAAERGRITEAVKRLRRDVDTEA